MRQNIFNCRLLDDSFYCFKILQYTTCRSNKISFIGNFFLWNCKNRVLLDLFTESSKTISKLILAFNKVHLNIFRENFTLDVVVLIVYVLSLPIKFIIPASLDSALSVNIHELKRIQNTVYQCPPVIV